MFRQNDNKKLFSTLFLGVYLFVALFAQSFHQHGSSVSLGFKNIQSETTFSEAKDFSHSASCIWCHFVWSGNSVVPEVLALSFYQFVAISEVQEFAVADYSFQKPYQLYLRGPPLYHL